MQVQSRAWRIEMDIGDTFTDLLLVIRDGRPALA